MAKWDLSKLPEGRKPLPDEWFAERAQMQERIKGLEAENADLKAKLAKAVEALEKLDVGEGWAAQIARATLAELTGDKDE